MLDGNWNDPGTTVHEHRCSRCGDAYDCYGDWERVDDFSSRGICLAFNEGDTKCDACCETDWCADCGDYESEPGSDYCSLCQPEHGED